MTTSSTSGSTTGTGAGEAPTTQYLQRPGGRLAYDVVGSGPLVVCSPGMGDLRSSFRFLAPALVAAGHRVATMDLRGHGESDTTFDDHGDVATGTDLLALVEHLGGSAGEPAVLVGTSMSAGSAVWAAAEAPSLVAGLVLLGPFVRDVPSNWAMRAAFRLAVQRPWGPSVWSAWFARLFPASPPADLAEQRAAIRASLARPGGWSSFQATTRTTHAPVEARMDEVDTPTLVVMGTADPDFPDPVAEAELVADRLGGEVLMVPEAGHYPHVEFPDFVTPRVVDFLASVHGDGSVPGDGSVLGDDAVAGDASGKGDAPGHGDA